MNKIDAKRLIKDFITIVGAPIKYNDKVIDAYLDDSNRTFILAGDINSNECPKCGRKLVNTNNVECCRSCDLYRLKDK